MYTPASFAVAILALACQAQAHGGWGFGDAWDELWGALDERHMSDCEKNRTNFINNWENRNIPEPPMCPTTTTTAPMAPGCYDFDQGTWIDSGDEAQCAALDAQNARAWRVILFIALGLCGGCLVCGGGVYFIMKSLSRQQDTQRDEAAGGNGVHTQDPTGIQAYDKAGAV